jgi:putative addiction module component (TIGR02574 family)
MREEATDLLKKALTLTAKERAELASSLIESLDPVTGEDVEAAWQAEIAHRLDDLRSGKVTTVPWEQVRNKARAILPDETAR